MSYEAGPYSIDHGYLQWGGSLPGNEIWSCGLRMAALDNFVGPGLDLTPSDIEDYLDYFVEKVTAFHQRSTTKISSNAILNFVKFNHIDINGHYDPPGTTHVRFLNPGLAGGGNANMVPNQIALALTLTTDVLRGPANKGRIYLPTPAVNLGSDGLLTTADANAIMGSFRTFLEDLSDTPGADSVSSPDVVVMSRKSGSPAARYVTGVRVGRVLDTQRRRRNAMRENYVTDVVDFGAA